MSGDFSFYVPHSSHLTGAPPRLVVLLDGDVWRDRLPIGPTLDNLHADGAIEPTVVLLHACADEADRWETYAASRAFLDHLTTEALPAVAARSPAWIRTTAAP